MWQARHRCEGLDQSRSPADTPGPVSLSSAWAGTASQPFSCALLWMEGGVHPSGGSDFETARQAAEVQLWTFLMLSVLGIHASSPVIARMPSVGLGAPGQFSTWRGPQAWLELLGTAMDWRAWSCQPGQNEPPYTAPIPASAEMRKLEENASSPPPRGTFRGVEQTSVEWSQWS